MLACSELEVVAVVVGEVDMARGERRHRSCRPSLDWLRAPALFCLSLHAETRNRDSMGSNGPGSSEIHVRHRPTQGKQHLKQRDRLRQDREIRHERPDLLQRREPHQQLDERRFWTDDVWRVEFRSTRMESHDLSAAELVRLDRGDFAGFDGDGAARDGG